MNERNVGALIQLLADLEWRTGSHELEHRGLAEKLAARGVLVPSALTDQECEMLRTAGVSLGQDVHEPGTPYALRFYLEHIASDQPVQWVGDG